MTVAGRNTLRQLSEISFPAPRFNASWHGISGMLLGSQQVGVGLRFSASVSFSARHVHAGFVIVVNDCCQAVGEFKQPQMRCRCLRHCSTGSETSQAAKAT